MNALEFNNVSLKIGNAAILDNITFEVRQGEIYGLIGHNGAGKTSLIRILLGLTTSYSGEIRILSDRNLNEKRKLIGEVLDSINADKTLSGAQYLRQVGYMLGQNPKEGVSELLERVGLQDIGSKRISQFSLGMKRRLMIAGALVGKPEILVLDEPFNGIDPEGMADLRLMLAQLRGEGVTILVTSHNIPELIKLATTFGILHNGEFVGEISSVELSKMSLQKTVFRTDNPQRLSDAIKKNFPQFPPFSNSVGEISIFEELDNGAREKILAALPDGLVKEVSRKLMSEEEILLWKMNGRAR